MKKIRDILVRTAMLLCILMQVAFLMPHHHHGPDEVPCINPLHCINTCLGSENNVLAADDSGHCPCTAHEHEHEHEHDGPADNCSFTHQDIIHPEKDRSSDQVTFNYSLACIQVLVPGIDTATEITTYHTGSISGPRSPDLLVFICYVNRAIPPRAPSFTV